MTIRAVYRRRCRSSLTVNEPVVRVRKDSDGEPEGDQGEESDLNPSLSRTEMVR